MLFAQNKPDSFNAVQQGQQPPTTGAPTSGAWSCPLCGCMHYGYLGGSGLSGGQDGPVTPAAEIDAPTSAPNGSYTREGEASIKYDGSPTAYGPNGLGDDNLANAGRPGNWWGVATDSNGNPIINPSNGHYVSTTAWSRGPAGQQSSYVNAERVPGVAITAADRASGVHMGDKVLITNKATGQTTWSVVTDYAGSRGPNHVEITPAAARQVGVGYNRRGVSSNGSISLQFFPGTATGQWYE